jgi:hypothetical protein
MDKQYEGSAPPGHNVGSTPTNGCATPKVRKASVTPTPSDKGNEGKGKG